MKLVIRLQDKTGTGIFQTNIFKKYGYGNSVDKAHWNMMLRHNDFNTPQRDLGIEEKFIEGTHRCAYKSLDQLQEWIPRKEIKKFIRRGIVVLCHTVSDCFIGEHQICYDPIYITSTEDISELFL